jgi:cell wall-associated NlpC family hydrolase
MKKKYVKKQELIAQARTWLGTKFQHQGRQKKSQHSNGAIDCLGFVICVAKELNLLSGVVNKNKRELFIHEFDDIEYSRSSNPAKLLQGFSNACIEIEFSKTKPGDLILCEFEGQPKHIAILTNYHLGGLGMIHAFVKSGGVVEHRLTDAWQKKIVKTYKLRRIKN